MWRRPPHWDCLSQPLSLPVYTAIHALRVRTCLMAPSIGGPYKFTSDRHPSAPLRAGSGLSPQPGGHGVGVGRVAAQRNPVE